MVETKRVSGLTHLEVFDDDKLRKLEYEDKRNQDNQVSAPEIGHLVAISYFEVIASFDFLLPKLRANSVQA